MVLWTVNTPGNKKMNRDAVIFGYSGHAYVVIEMLVANKYNMIGYFDREHKEKDPFKIDYLGAELNQSALKKIKNCGAFIGIGNNKVRADIFKRLVENHISCPAVAHNNSIISPSTQIGSGTVIMAGAVINAMVKIGNAVICNTSSVIDHECIIGDYAHIAPGAVLAGNVIVGNNTFIGANSVIKQGITIGADVIIGAGSVVLNDVASGLTIYGNPAKEREKQITI
jgi:sugar O-acyltransferase (sialic acid O-acetyltransferase NeuD family)